MFLVDLNAAKEYFTSKSYINEIKIMYGIIPIRDTISFCTEHA